MADKIEIVNDSGSNVRVALDLLKTIYMSMPNDQRPKTEADFIEMYRRCLKATYSPA